MDEAASATCFSSRVTKATSEGSGEGFGSAGGSSAVASAGFTIVEAATNVQMKRISCPMGADLQKEGELHRY